MAHFALLWKARTIEKYRQNYENEKINSIIMSNAEIPEKTLFQKWRHYSHNLQNRLSRTFSRWYPEGTTVSNFYVSLRSDNMRLPNILLRSFYGFVGGLLLSYLGFMFFVFQLSLSLIHATVLSSILGILLTLGLTFSNRMRCLIFLLIPQLFSRVGRYTLTCYALVLILTGPATNTLKNSEILSESMACSQEQIRTNVRQINESIKKPYNSIQSSLKITIHNMKLAVAKLKTAVIRIGRLILSLATVTQASFSWLDFVANDCNKILGTPKNTCINAINDHERDTEHITKSTSNTSITKKKHKIIQEDKVNDAKILNKKWFKFLHRKVLKYANNKKDKLKNGKDIIHNDIKNKEWFQFLRRKIPGYANKDVKIIEDKKEVKDRKWFKRRLKPGPDYVSRVVCSTLKVYDKYCVAADFVEESFFATVKRKLKSFTNHLNHLLHMKLNIQHTYIFIGNSGSTNHIASGIVTEIRNRADPILTWLSWSSCVTSLFLLLIIFRAKHYQHMFETRSRFDNRFITQEFRELDLQRLRERRETVLPLNRRERAKYVTTTSFRLVASEKIHLNRSAIFMTVTTFKLLIHVVADYSLYWVLMTIKQHGKLKSSHTPPPESGAFISGPGFVSRLLQSFIDSLNVHLSFPPLDNSCLPNPYAPDFKRYCQIGFLIILLWFFAIFEPYGLRIRHIIMGNYRPERAKTRALWLYNHILRTRASFMKFARRRLHREYKYYSHSNLTLRRWLETLVPYAWLRTLLCIKHVCPRCLLCNITEKSSVGHTQLIRCQVSSCPGIYCNSCFSDIGELCTICLRPSDYGDLSDISLERGSSDDDDSSYDNGDDDYFNDNHPRRHKRGNAATHRTNTYTDTTLKRSKFDKQKSLTQLKRKRGKKGDNKWPMSQRYDTRTHMTNNQNNIIAFQMIVLTESEDNVILKQLKFKENIINKNCYKIYKDKNNNDISLPKHRTYDFQQYSAYEINPTKTPFVVKTSQSTSLVAIYLRKKGIIRCRKRKKMMMKRRKKRRFKMKKRQRKLCKRNISSKNSKDKERSDMKFFMTCSTARNDVKVSDQINKSANLENNENREEKQPMNDQDKGDLEGDNQNQTPSKVNKSSNNHYHRCACIRKFHTALTKYWPSTKPSSKFENKPNLQPLEGKKHKRKKKSSSTDSDNRSKDFKDLPKHSRLLAYFDDWDWMQRHSVHKQNGTTSKYAKDINGKDVTNRNNNEHADVEIVNNIEIPRLDLRQITESVNDKETHKDQTGESVPKENSYARGALDRFFQSFVFGKRRSKISAFVSRSIKDKNKAFTVYSNPSDLNKGCVSRDRSKNSGFFSLSRPLSLLRNIYSSLLLRLNYVEEPEASGDIVKNVETDNKDITVLPQMCSCACQYDLSNTDIIKNVDDCSTQVNFISVDEKPVLVDAKIGSEQPMCSCATQYQPTNINIGTTIRHSDIYSLNKSHSSISIGISESDTLTESTLCNYCVKRRERTIRDRCSRTKAHISTTTERPNCDVSTSTDWWSPILDKRDLKKYETDRHNERRYKFKNSDVQIARNENKKSTAITTARLVTFNSSAQIIPRDARFDDLMSPSRYLLESQWYYNELFCSSFNYRSPQHKKRTSDRYRSQVSGRQNGHSSTGRKAKRLEETYYTRATKKQSTSTPRKKAHQRSIRHKSYC